MGFLYFVGFRYWTASLLPALVGTTLPFWLSPPDFSFRLLAAFEFVAAVVLVHAGFSSLHYWFEGRYSTKWSRSRLLKAATVFLVAGCLLGLHINSGLNLHKGVFRSIFIIYGLSALFAGVLFVAPPFSLCRRVGGEIVLAEGLGLIPVIGAYLVQVGDITRKVYVAALPIVIVTGLWVWIDRLVSRADDEKRGRHTMILLFGPHLSGRYGVLALSLLLFATIFLAVFSASVAPFSLVALLFGWLTWKIVAVSWFEYSCQDRMVGVREGAFNLHLAVCSIIVTSSLVSQII